MEPLRSASAKRWAPPLLGLALCLALVPAFPAHAKNHLWRFTEVFSNADGTIQFIEMQECCGSDEEILLGSTTVSSNTVTYLFPNDLTGPTANRWILIATQGFAALPGAPAPDYIIPDGFFDPTDDVLRYRGVTDTLPITPGALPLDGVNGLSRDISTGVLSVAVNSPINFAGESGSVIVAPAIPVAGPAVWVVAAVAGAGLFALRRRRLGSRATSGRSLDQRG